MKILFITPYITNSAHPALLRNKSGFGYMVNDIARYVGKVNDVNVFPVNAFVPELQLDGFRIEPWSVKRLLKSFSIKTLIKAIRYVRRYPVPLKDRLRILYQFLAVAARRKSFEECDTVHIHGCSPITAAAIDMCKMTGRPFVITLHGLVSFEESIRLHPTLKQYEKDFLTEAYNNDYNLTFISSGNMKQALDFVTANNHS